MQETLCDLQNNRLVYERTGALVTKYIHPFNPPPHAACLWLSVHTPCKSSAGLRQRVWGNEREHRAGRLKVPGPTAQASISTFAPKLFCTACLPHSAHNTETTCIIISSVELIVRYAPTKPQNEPDVPHSSVRNYILPQLHTASPASTSVLSFLQPLRELGGRE